MASIFGVFDLADIQSKAGGKSWRDSGVTNIPPSWRVDHERVSSAGLRSWLELDATSLRSNAALPQSAG